MAAAKARLKMLNPSLNTTKLGTTPWTRLPLSRPILQTHCVTDFVIDQVLKIGELQREVQEVGHRPLPSHAIRRQVSPAELTLHRGPRRGRAFATQKDPVD